MLSIESELLMILRFITEVMNHWGKIKRNDFERSIKFQHSKSFRAMFFEVGCLDFDGSVPYIDLEKASNFKSWQ